jgi:hypothetical protein
MMKTFDPLQYLIFEGYSGSILYGTNTPESDVDTRGICVPPMDVLLDPFNNFEVKDGFEGEDRAIYSLAKFFKLCADANPNIMEMLFVPKDKTIFSTYIWEMIVGNKNLFLSKNIRYRFAGYAISQLEKIKRHREWFINPPDHKPTRKEYDLTSTPLVSEGALANVLGVPKYLFREDYQLELGREREYRDAKKKWDNYIQWKDTRNPKRRGTEEDYGYDSKCASHLFRLIEEGHLLLLTGEITFPLNNARELVDIKNGKYTYEEVLDAAKIMEESFDSWYNESTLPHSPDRNGLTELYFEIIRTINTP